MMPIILKWEREKRHEKDEGGVATTNVTKDISV